MRIFGLVLKISLAVALAPPTTRVAQSTSRWMQSSETATLLSTPILPLSPPALINNSPFHNKLRIARSPPSSTALSVASSSTSEKPPGPSKTKIILATAALVLFDTQFRSLFVHYSIPFPSSLAGCGALFSGMLLLNVASGGTLGENLFKFLNPGAVLLAKWLPVFFVPSLITLPLASGLGNAWEVLKLFSVIIGGFFFTLLTTAGSVLGVRNLMGGETETTRNEGFASTIEASTTPATNKPQKPFSRTLFRSLKAIAWISGISTVSLVKNCSASQWINPFRSLFLLSMTLSTFVFGANLPKSFTKIVHPLVTCTTLTWLASNILAYLTGTTFLKILKTYKAGTLAPMSAGAGDALLFCLGPAVVALACQMYGRKKLMRENIPEVGVSTLVSALGGLYGTAAAVRLLGIANTSVRLSLLSRNITSPLAMAIASILGADASLAVTIVVLTGLFGANFGATILDAFRINDAVARGLGIGAAAHGLGTAAFANEKDAFPFAAIAMALTASACTVLVSIPVVKSSVLKLALGM
mmetsp:Transcript_3695/g.8196  ORF Transcript_3695/g.8196 Transcript_3695/m.8196 type:complete len:529 (-) Transcript_3695:109-1695(-)